MSALFGFLQRITRAAAATWILLENAAIDEVLNIAERGVMGALRQLRPLHRRELSLKTVVNFAEGRVLSPHQY